MSCNQHISVVMKAWDEFHRTSGPRGKVVIVIDPVNNILASVKKVLTFARVDHSCRCQRLSHIKISHSGCGGRYDPQMVKRSSEWVSEWVSAVSTWIAYMPCNSGWLRGTVVERRSLTDKLSLFGARSAADGWPLMWVNRLLRVSQPGRLSLSSFWDR